LFVIKIYAGIFSAEREREREKRERKERELKS
jgi:hypothetical protein